MKYHSDLTSSELVELEKLSDSQFFHTVDFICSIPDSGIAESGYKSLIDEFSKMQKQYLKVEHLFCRKI